MGDGDLTMTAGQSSTAWPMAACTDGKCLHKPASPE